MRDPPCVFSFKPFLFLDRHLPTLLQLPESMARDLEMYHSAETALQGGIPQPPHMTITLAKGLKDTTLAVANLD